MNNDLISREALKKKLTPIKLFGGAYCKAITEKDIDNAPAVEPEKAKESELIKAYTKGFDTGVETVKGERPQGEIRWTDKLSVTSSGDIIDFEGRVVGHINL